MTSPPISAHRRSLPSSPRKLSIERTILLSVFFVLAFGTFLLLTPFWPWFVLALWTSGIARPAVDGLTRLIRGRRSAAGLFTLALIVVLALPMVALVASVAPDAYEIGRRAMQSPSGRGALVELVSGSDGNGDGSGAPLNFATAMQLIEQHGAQAITAITSVAGAVGSIVLGLFVYFAASYAAMVHGSRAYAWIESELPIAPQRLRRFADAFMETGRGLLFSVVLTGFVQALLATASYALLGVPRASALGLATFVTSVIPSFGSALVWVPVSLGLLFAGHTTRALVLLGLGFGVVSTADNLLRPWFARWGKLTLNPFLVLFSMLGGVFTVGGWGLILGPLVLRLALEALTMVRELQRSNAAGST